MKRKQTKKAVDRHIRITDIDMLEQIDEIMEDPEYKSFSKVINDALFYGLPILRNKLYGEVTLDDEQPAPQRPQINGSRLDDELFDTIVKLMKETVLNVTINKSILSSVYHDLGRVNKVLQLDNDLYEKGLMSDTPDYLYEYELEGLKKLRR
ncbi:MAG: hypothetical protein HDT28_02355 [Clostridiales bacterium]|nr:hypothetical protein [Clostridiales bacterium]